MSSEAMVSRPYTRFAAVFFAVLAFVHILRLVFAVEVMIGGAVIPLGVSLPVAVTATALAVLLGRESRGLRSW